MLTYPVVRDSKCLYNNYAGICGQDLGWLKVYRILTVYLCLSFTMQGVLFVYDVTNTASFDNLEDWLVAIKSILGTSSKKAHFALVANKGEATC
jgi:Ras family